MKLPALNATAVSPAFSGGGLLAGLQPQREGQEDPCSPTENASCTPSPAAKAGTRNSAVCSREARVPSPPRASARPSTASPPTPAAEHQPRPRRPAELAPLQQRVHDRHQRPGQQHRARHVRPPRARVPGLRDEPQPGDQRAARHRDVDEEHRAPAPPEQVRVGQHPAEQQPDRRGEAQHGPVDAERLAPFGPGEDGTERGQDLRRHRCCRRALDHPGGDQLRPVARAPRRPGWPGRTRPPRSGTPACGRTGRRGCPR